VVPLVSEVIDSASWNILALAFSYSACLSSRDLTRLASSVDFSDSEEEKLFVDAFLLEEFCRCMITKFCLVGLSEVLSFVDNLVGEIDEVLSDDLF